jgi:hypothetical protein
VKKFVGCLKHGQHWNLTNYLKSNTKVYTGHDTSISYIMQGFHFGTSCKVFLLCTSLNQWGKSSTRQVASVRYESLYNSIYRVLHSGQWYKKCTAAQYSSECLHLHYIQKKWIQFYILIIPTLPPNTYILAQVTLGLQCMDIPILNYVLSYSIN